MAGTPSKAMSTKARSAKKMNLPGIPGAIPKGTKLSPIQKSMRNNLMLARKAEGWTWEEIAMEAGLTIKGAKLALRKHRENVPDLLNMDPLEIIETIAQGFLHSIADFEKMSVAYAERHPSAAVGAKKAADDARRRLTEMLQATGKLPKKLGTLTHLIEVRSVAVVIVTAVDEFVQMVEGLDGLDDKQRNALAGSAREVRTKMEEVAGLPPE